MHCPKGTMKKASIIMKFLLPNFLCISYFRKKKLLYIITAPCVPAQPVRLVLRDDRQLQSDALPSYL